MPENAYRESLPAEWFYDPGHYRLELQRIWGREWLCVGREEDWPATGDFRRVRLGDQQVVVTRAADGALHAFHNTCRHRGSLLCEADAGRFEQGRIVCPYHAWSYGLDGQLLRAPRSTAADALDPEDFSLYRVALESWGGFVFVRLAEDPTAASRPFPGPEASHVEAWPLADLRCVHEEVHRVACNWKIFWENYLECYHCPGVHAELCQLVPLYRSGRAYPAAGNLAAEAVQDAARVPTMLRPGAVTWSEDGQTALPWFEGLGETERQAGMTFADFWPTMFLIAHVDYLRTVRVLPLGPEETQLTVDWYVHRDTLGHPALDVGKLTAFARRVVQEDARVCELNQAGLRSRRHHAGVLLELENDVHEFEQWVRERVGHAGR